MGDKAKWNYPEETKAETTKHSEETKVKETQNLFIKFLKNKLFLNLENQLNVLF